MKYGMNTLLWSPACDESITHILGRIKDWGFDGAELPILGPMDAKDSVHGLQKFSQVGSVLDGLGLGRTAVTICTPETNPISSDRRVRLAARDHLKAVLDCAKALGAEVLCGPFHSALGAFTGKGPTGDEWKWGQSTLAAVAEYAKQQDIMLALEALNRFECYFLTCVDDAVRFCTEVEHSHLGMMYDTFHAHIEEKAPMTAVRSCKGQLAHVHISENDRSTPGEGQVHWPETFGALEEIGYNGWLVIEAFGQAMPDLAAATKIWRKMFSSEEQLARKGIAFMQQMAGGTYQRR